MSETSSDERSDERIDERSDETSDDNDDDDNKKLNISFETLQELSKKLFEPFNEHDKTEKIEKMETSNNLPKEVVDKSRELLKTIK